LNEEGLDLGEGFHFDFLLFLHMMDFAYEMIEILGNCVILGLKNQILDDGDGMVEFLLFGRKIIEKES
jgi:hypothetical protein